MDKILPSVPQRVPRELRFKGMFCLRDRSEKEASETPLSFTRLCDFTMNDF